MRNAGILNSQFSMPARPAAEKPQITQIDADRIAIAIGIDCRDPLTHRAPEAGSTSTFAGSFVVHASRVHVQPGRLHHNPQMSEALSRCADRIQVGGISKLKTDVWAGGGTF